MASVLVCELDGNSFKRDSNKKCIIEQEIENLKYKLTKLKEYVNFINLGGKECSHRDKKWNLDN